MMYKKEGQGWVWNDTTLDGMSKFDPAVCAWSASGRTAMDRELALSQCETVAEVAALLADRRAVTRMADVSDGAAGPHRPELRPVCRPLPA